MQNALKATLWGLERGSLGSSRLKSHAGNTSKQRSSGIRKESRMAHEMFDVVLELSVRESQTRGEG